MSGHAIEPRHSHPQRFRPRTLELPDGGKLVLGSSETISHLDADGTTKKTWSPADPDWARMLLRFGLHEAEPTVAPSGRGSARPKPPR